MRIAIIYDCLFPHTIGGAERWYRMLADSLSERHEVTYVTRRQWPAGEDPDTAFDVIGVSAGGPLCTESGRRKITPPLRFGLGVFWHLLRNPNRYDVVDCCSFPFFSCLGAWLALKLRRSRTKLVVDWFECWNSVYWIDYLGWLGGRVGYAIQRLALKASPAILTYSELARGRLREEQYDGEVVRIPGLYPGSAKAAEAKPASRPPRVVFAGRHIPDKRVTSIPPAVAAARQAIPALRCTIFGDGPEWGRVMALVRDLGLEDAIDCPGFVGSDQVEQALGTALCLILPSRREGYGLVVVEATSVGTPTVVTAAPDNAATELVGEGINGFVAPSASASDLAAAIVKIHELGDELRARTAEWFTANAERLSMRSSIATVEAFFARV